MKGLTDKRGKVTDVWREVVDVGMARDITTAAWISILQPSAAYIFVLLVHNKIDVLALFLDHICHHYTAEACTDAENLDIPLAAVKHSLLVNLIGTGALVHNGWCFWDTGRHSCRLNLCDYI